MSIGDRAEPGKSNRPRPASEIVVARQSPAGHHPVAPTGLHRRSSLHLTSPHLTSSHLTSLLHTQPHCTASAPFLHPLPSRGSSLAAPSVQRRHVRTPIRDSAGPRTRSASSSAQQRLGVVGKHMGLSNISCRRLTRPRESVQHSTAIPRSICFGTRGTATTASHAAAGESHTA